MALFKIKYSYFYVTDDLRTENPFINDDTFSSFVSSFDSSFSNNGHGSADSLDSVNSDQFSSPQPIQESDVPQPVLNTDFGLPESFRSAGAQEMYKI